MRNMQHILLVLFLAATVKGYGQKEGDNWDVGSNPICRINFTTGTQVDSVCPTFQVTKFWGGASISDTNGNPLFFTNGVRLFNANCDTIANGYGVCQPLYSNASYSGTRVFQDNIIIPKKDNNYYVINYSVSDNSFNTTGIWDLLTYHIVDMNANSGQGEVVSKNNLLLNVPMNGAQFTACRHAQWKRLVDCKICICSKYVLQISIYA